MITASHRSGEARYFPSRRQRIVCLLSAVSGLLLFTSGEIADAQTLRAAGAISIPDVPVGPYADFMAIDLQGQRLFATPQAAKEVAVLDLARQKVVATIKGIGNPHGIHFDAKTGRLFVADGSSGDVKVYDTHTYDLLKAIKLAPGADHLTYDPTTNLMYVNNGGEDAGISHSIISVIDCSTMEKIADINVDAKEIEATAIDTGRQVLYVNLPSRRSVVLVDLRTRTVMATWKMPTGDHYNIAMALDVDDHRLYIASRDEIAGNALHGTLSILDSETGGAVASFSIGGWCDGIFVDHPNGRVYVITGVGRVETFAIRRDLTLTKVGDTETPLLAKTGLFVPEIARLFIAVPHLGDTPAQVMVFATK